MTISSVTIIGPVAIPQRDSSADHAGGWLVGCVSSLWFASFYLRFVECLYSWWRDTDREDGGVFTGMVFAGCVGASRCPFQCSFLINKLHIRTAQLLRS